MKGWVMRCLRVCASEFEDRQRHGNAKGAEGSRRNSEHLG